MTNDGFIVGSEEEYQRTLDLLRAQGEGRVKTKFVGGRLVADDEVIPVNPMVLEEYDRLLEADGRGPNADPLPREGTSFNISREALSGLQALAVKWGYIRAGKGNTSYLLEVIGQGKLKTARPRDVEDTPDPVQDAGWGQLRGMG